MSDRRQAQRFALSSPAHAQLHLAQDVVIERSDATGLTVLSAISSMAGEQFAIRLRAFDGRIATVSVRTRASRPVLLEGESCGIGWSYRYWTTTARPGGRRR